MKKIFTLAMLTLLLVACGSSTDAEGPLSLDLEETSEADEILTIPMFDNYFTTENDNIANPPVWTVDAGESVALALENRGNARHNWVLLEQEADIDPAMSEEEKTASALFNSGKLSGGDQESVAFRAPEVGEYLVICSVAGHYPLMQGRLVVE